MAVGCRIQKPVRQFCVFAGVVHADARGDLDGVVGHEQTAVFNPEFFTAERKPVVGDGESEQFRHLAGTAADVGGDASFAGALQHQFLAVGGDDAADEHGVGNVLGVGDEVEQMVHSVAEIDVCDAALVVHHVVAVRASSPEGMRRAVGSALVRLRLVDDAAGELPVHPREQELADQVARQRHDIVREEIVFRQFHCR